jgi:hypothetical protein
MAKHLSEWRGVPVFFYGQNYGFSFIEALFVSLGYKLLGFGALALKLSMLTLWTTGVLFYYAAASNISGTGRKGFWITLLLIFIPAWARWSMEARGGYITAFVLSSVIIFLISRPGASRMKWFIIGALTGLVFLSQRVWVIGLIPLFFLLWKKEYKILNLISFFFGTALMVIVVFLSADFMQNGSNAEFLGVYINLDPRVNTYILRFLELIYVNLTGFYYMEHSFRPDPVTGLIAAIWVLLIITGAAIRIMRIKNKNYNAWANALFLSTAFTALFIPLLGGPFFGYRYILPLSGFMILWIGVEALDYAGKNIRIRKAQYILLFILITLGVYSLISFRNFSFLPKIEISGKDANEEKMMDSFIGSLKDNGIRYAFSLEPLLTWYVMFYSKEEVLSRCTEPYDRYPGYPHAVDKAFEEGKRSAIIGYAHDIPGYLLKNPDNIIVAGTRYFIYPDPGRELLVSIGLTGNRNQDRKVCVPLQYKDPKTIIIE